MDAVDRAERFGGAYSEGGGSTRGPSRALHPRLRSVSWSRATLARRSPPGRPLAILGAIGWAARIRGSTDAGSGCGGEGGSNGHSGARSGTVRSFPGLGVVCGHTGSEILVGSRAFLARWRIPSLTARSTRRGVDRARRLAPRFRLDRGRPPTRRRCSCGSPPWTSERCSSPATKRRSGALARQLGVDEVESELLPQQKLERIRALTKGGRSTANHRGRGSSRARRGEVGIAVGTGTAAATLAACIHVASELGFILNSVHLLPTNGASPVSTAYPRAARRSRQGSGAHDAREGAVGECGIELSPHARAPRRRDRASASIAPRRLSSRIGTQTGRLHGQGATTPTSAGASLASDRYRPGTPARDDVTRARCNREAVTIANGAWERDAWRPSATASSPS